MAWTNYLDLYFLSAGYRRIESQTTRGCHFQAPDFGRRLDRDRVPHPSGAIVGSVAHSKQDVRTLGRHAHLGSRADVDTSDCLLRHHARKSTVVVAWELTKTTNGH
jgi:hypothetical protein